MPRLGASAFLLFLVLAPAGAAAAERFGGPPLSTLPRDEDVVTLTGSQVQDLIGEPISHLALFRYDGPTNSFLPIPFQIDQKVDHVFNSGTPVQFTETTWDFFGEDDGLLDANDEISFLFGDGGAQAFSTAPWPAGASPVRVETSVTDSRPGTGTTRFAYLFSGEGLPRSTGSSVSWDGGRYSSMTTSLFALDFTDRWLLTGLRIQTPCGTAADLLDRAKGRAGANPQLGETEETWNNTSTYIGGIVGPVRAIRGVLGAASGLNTTHYDIVSRSRWTRRVNLRVHSLTQIWFYFDLRPNSGALLFTPATPTGMAVDGVVDPSAPKPLQSWFLLRSSLGGFITVPTVPPSPYYGTVESYIVDNAAYNDAPPTGTYPDEDNSAYGDHGVTLKNLSGDEHDLIPMTFSVYPLCSDQGDAAMAASYQQLTAYPLQNVTIPQWTVGGPVRSLQTVRDGSDVILDWDSLENVTGYKVYVGLAPSLPHASWSSLGQTSGSQMADRGAAADTVSRYYSIVSLTPAGEGPW